MRRKMRLSGYIWSLLTAKIWGCDDYFTMCLIKYYTLVVETQCIIIL